MRVGERFQVGHSPGSPRHEISKLSFCFALYKLAKAGFRPKTKTNKTVNENEQDCDCRWTIKAVSVRSDVLSTVSEFLKFPLWQSFVC